MAHPIAVTGEPRDKAIAAYQRRCCSESLGMGIITGRVRVVSPLPSSVSHLTDRPEGKGGMARRALNNGAEMESPR